MILAFTIYTSYWNNSRLSTWGGYCICISRGAPRWKLPYKYQRLPILYPSASLLASYKEGQISAEEFSGVYRKYLDTLDPDRISHTIEVKGEGRPVVLLCWESPDKFCHRRLVADWLGNHLGSEVPELSNEKGR